MTTVLPPVRLARSVLLFACTLLLAALPLQAQDDLPSITEKTEGMEPRDGFFPLYWDAAEGTLWLEIPRLDEDFLYVHALPAGLGSNDVGLDRGQLGGERVVRFERVGPKVLLVEPNLRYRATTDNPAEQRAVEDAFASAVVWGFTVGAATDDRVLVDATDFVVRDAHGAVRRLKQTGQGTFQLDERRSAVYLPMTKNFPENTEMEARLTFTTDDPGRFVRDAAADPYAVTLRVRHSFVKLPEPGYTPRPFHVRSGYFGASYEDYAAPIGEELTQRVITRHRLSCAGPPDADGLCAPSAPIVYYLDPGTPEPVRSALLDGARWWSAAFEAAGYRDAFRVEMLPEDADPLDVRYNIIQWVHRSTRGWSYGASVTDPRTGEIIKGHVSLGSLRVRQDYLLAEGLLAPYQGEHAEGFPPENDPMLQMALARIRQLSAHEIGHTLGLAHNFAASTADRASVMDYPAPLATVVGDSVSLENAYDTGIGAWDVVAIRYGYTDVPDDADEPEMLRSILDEARADGLTYLTDADARPGGAAEPSANLWDNGEAMVAALRREMAVRRVALDRFSPAVLRMGRPLATMEETLVPLYLRHRYQVDATTKLIGGVRYRYVLRDETLPRPAPVEADVQRAALGALLDGVTPEALRLPDTVRMTLPPRPPGYSQNRELFGGYSGLTFDPYAPAEVAAAMILGGLIHPERAARLAYQHDHDASLPGLRDALARIDAQVWETPVPSDPYDAELQRLVQQVWTDVLLETAARDDLAPAVRARLTDHLRTRRDALRASPGQDAETTAHRALLLDQLDRFLTRAYVAAERRARPDTPPGSPIGADAPGYRQRQQQRRAWLDHHATSARMPGCGMRDTGSGR